MRQHSGTQVKWYCTLHSRSRRLLRKSSWFRPRASRHALSDELWNMDHVRRHSNTGCLKYWSSTKQLVLLCKWQQHQTFVSAVCPVREMRSMSLLHEISNGFSTYVTASLFRGSDSAEQLNYCDCGSVCTDRRIKWMHISWIFPSPSIFAT